MTAIGKTLTGERASCASRQRCWWAAPNQNGGADERWIENARRPPAASIFRASLDELEGLVGEGPKTTLDLAGQLALREAWWRAPVALGPGLTASSFMLWEVPSPRDFVHDKPGRRAARAARCKDRVPANFQ